MRKTYPYLQDGYILDYGEEETKRRNFLQKIDEFANQRQYVRITLLNWDEEPIKALEGIISGGSLSKNGSSSVRCTCQFSASLGYGEYDIQNEEADFAINKKIFLEIGVKNDSDEYLDYPILWFPQGVFFISSFSANSSASSAVNINVGLKDKMAMLNGDVGGTLPALVVLDTVNTQLPDGSYQKQKVPIYSIIQELVNHYGREPISNIVIEDIDTRIRKVMKWNAKNPIYLISGEEDGESAIGKFYQFTLNKPDESTPYRTFMTGDDIGYTMADFIVPDELTAAAGESITSVLDRIVQILGNFEYFYDEYGIFHFREIKNYVNTSEGKLALDEASENQYMVEINNSKSTYSFTDTGNITSINITPRYENIKNDYVVLGLRQSTNSDLSYEVRYHLAIDEKPEIQRTIVDGRQIAYYGVYGGEDILVFYSEKTIYGYTGNIVAGFALGLAYASFPEIGNFDMLYQDITDIENNYPVYQWIGSGYEKVYIYDDSAPEVDQLQPPVVYSNLNEKQKVYYVKDWRTHFYLMGKLAEKNGTEKGYYYEELSANWPTIYSLIEQCFYAEAYDLSNREESKDPRVKHLGSTLNKHTALRSLTDGNYYLDFIHAPSSSIGGFSVEAIGRRTDLVYDEKINCLFQPEIPDVDILNIDDLVYNEEESTLLNKHTTLEEQRQESVRRKQSYTQVGNEIYSHLVTGGYSNPAFDRIKYELYLHTRYQKQVTLTALPVFYLEPNRRVSINEKSTNTHGDYVINNIGITLGPGANMSITANEVFERE